MESLCTRINNAICVSDVNNCFQVALLYTLQRWKKNNQPQKKRPFGRL